MAVARGFNNVAFVFGGSTASVNCWRRICRRFSASIETFWRAMPMSVFISTVVRSGFIDPMRRLSAPSLLCADDIETDCSRCQRCRRSSF